MAKSKKLKDSEIITYDNMKDECLKPQRERKAQPIGRNGAAVTPRKMHLSEAEIKRLLVQKEASGGTVNPFGLRKSTGLYHAQVEALIQLGVNEFHHCADVIAKIKEIMLEVPKKDKDGNGTNAWDASLGRTSGRDDVNPDKRKSIEGKIEQNYKVLQRLGKKDRYPYGQKLRQFKMSIMIECRLPEGIEDHNFAMPFFMLKTDWPTEESVQPSSVNPYSKRGKNKRKKLVAEAVEVEVIVEEPIVEEEVIAPEEEVVTEESHELEDEMFEEAEEEEVVEEQPTVSAAEEFEEPEYDNDFEGEDYEGYGEL